MLAETFCWDNGEKYKSCYCIDHQQDQFIDIFVNCLLLRMAHILLQEKYSVTGEIDHHEKALLIENLLATVENTNSGRV